MLKLFEFEVWLSGHSLAVYSPAGVCARGRRPLLLVWGWSRRDARVRPSWVCGSGPGPEPVPGPGSGRVSFVGASGAVLCWDAAKAGGTAGAGALGMDRVVG